MRSRKLVVMMGIAGIVIIGIAANKPPEDFKNLKVLPRNISEQMLDSVMGEFTRALKVECNFCHVQSPADSTKWDMASDDKPEKNIARKMITMANEINKQFFKATTKYGEENGILEVHCMTCHHGQPHPEMEEEEENSKQ